MQNNVSNKKDLQQRWGIKTFLFIPKMSLTRHLSIIHIFYTILGIIHIQPAWNANFYILWINILFFHLPFDHHLCYNNLVILDTPLCIWKCRIHLLSLLLVRENFPVALKMYFLLSVSALLYMDSMPSKDLTTKEKSLSTGITLLQRLSRIHQDIHRLTELWK